MFLAACISVTSSIVDEPVSFGALRPSYLSGLQMQYVRSRAIRSRTMYLYVSQACVDAGHVDILEVGSVELPVSSVNFSNSMLTSSIWVRSERPETCLAYWSSCSVSSKSHTCGPVELTTCVPTLLTATSVFVLAFIAAPPVDIDGIVAEMPSIDTPCGPRYLPYEVHR